MEDWYTGAGQNENLPARNRPPLWGRIFHLSYSCLKFENDGGDGANLTELQVKSRPSIQ